MPRFSSNRTLRHIRWILILLAIYSILEVFYIRHCHSTPHSHKPSSFDPENTRIYIASIHWNNEQILRSHWNDAVLELVRTFGPSNVFVSVHESGSWDGTKKAVLDLKTQLDAIDAPNNITTSDLTHDDVIKNFPAGPGRISTPDGKAALRRIPYLAQLRNESLWNLRDLHDKGIHFDKVLFLGDVVFTLNDIFKLFDTNDGDYAAACSLDFAKPPNFYDTFALRDSQGNDHVTQSWPYFRSRKSRYAMKTNQPVPVQSCWNGIVTMPPDSFYPPHQLGFRGISDSLAQYHLEASECCLIHADNPRSAQQGVFINPSVRVGYNPKAYEAVHSPSGNWLSPTDMFLGLWMNRIVRWFTSTFFKDWIVKRRLNSWVAEDINSNKEPGKRCLINEMQVLIVNGWAHV